MDVEVFLEECADVAVYSVVSTPRINVLMVGWIQGENPEGMAVTSGGIAWWGGAVCCTWFSFNLALCLKIFIIRC